MTPIQREKRLAKAFKNKVLLAKSAANGGQVFPLHPALVQRAFTPEPRGLPQNVAKFKADNHYESAPARCGNCKHIVRPRTVMINSVPVKNVPCTCKLGMFSVSRHGICDQWAGKDGSVLEN